MNTEELPPLPTEIPPGFTKLAITVEEVDYLMARWDLKDHGEIFNWAVKMLYDLSKLDEAGWHLTLQKCEISEETRQVFYDQGYLPVHVLMKWLRPTPERFARLPVAETLDVAMRVKKSQE